MARARKDPRGRSLKTGESFRNDGRYAYSYVDPLGRRRWIYSYDLVTLREREKELMRDQLDGLDIYARGKATVNNTFDRYMATKYDLAETTRLNYLYVYEHYVQNTFGLKKIVDVKYSDVLQFYLYLINEKQISLGTLDSVHNVIHPVFTLAVRDEIIRKNPSDGVMREITRRAGKNRGVRHALTVEQQRAFMNYLAKHPVFYHWWPMFTILLGTGCRIGEALGLRWQDLDFENRTISINHAIVYYPVSELNSASMRISSPKTEAGIRTIPMLDVVKDAFYMEKEDQEETGGLNNQVIDGMTGFVFRNKLGVVPSPPSVNSAIKRIVGSYNAKEVLDAKREYREPIILPHFTCHHLRHTFATRLCEAESNLKVIQAVMGHRNIETTMDVYAEATEQGKQASFEKLQSKLDNIF